MFKRDNKKDATDSTTEQGVLEFDKKLEVIELKKAKITKEKEQLFVGVRELKDQLKEIYNKESFVESRVAEVKDEERKAPPGKKEKIEKKRWLVDAERREIEKAKWQILEEIKKQEKRIKEIDLEFQEALKEAEGIKKEKEKVFKEKRKKELLRGKAGLKDEFLQLSYGRKLVGSRRDTLLAQKDKLKNELKRVSREEKNTESSLAEIETREKEVSDTEKKIEIEKERWKVEDFQRGLEKQRWELEKEERRLLPLLGKTEEEYREILRKEGSLKERIKAINLELGLPLEEKLPEAPDLPKGEKGAKSRAAEKRPLELKVFFGGKPQVSAEKRSLFKEAFNSYKKGDFSVARDLLNKIIAVGGVKEEKPAGFLTRMMRSIRGASLEEKARVLLGKIGAKEEGAQAEPQAAIGLESKEAEPAKEREELKKYQEDLVKRYKEELEAQKKEAARKYQEELEKQKNELLQKQKELQENRQKLREEALEEVIRREKMREQEGELEKQKEKIEEKYQQEVQRIKKELQQKQAEELKKRERALGAKDIEKIQEELRKQEAEAQRMREEPEEVLTEEERTKKNELILEAEEGIREKRRMVEEETRKIEEEEIKRKKSEEKFKGEEPREEIGATAEEIEKRRVWLKEAIRKEKMAPEGMKKEQKEKAENLNTLLKEAIFHYKERNLDKAVEIFRELKKKLPEPEKEPGFFLRLFKKPSLYIRVEDYISKIEKEKESDEKKKIEKIREGAKTVSEGKKKAAGQLLSRLKKKASKWLPASPLVIFRKFLFLPPLVAVDISDYSIELLRLNKKLSVLANGRSTVKEGIVDEGRIKNQRELSLAFKLAANQAGFKSFKPKRGPILRGIVSIPEYKTNVQTFTFDSKDNVFEKVKEEIKKTIPFSIDDLYWDYLESWDEKSNKAKILSVAVSKDIIDEQVYFLKSCGAEPVVFDFEAASIGRALLPENTISEKTSILIMDIGARVTNINIFDENKFIDSSIAIPAGGNYLVDKIAKHFGVSKEEAETIINIKGFNKEDNIILEVLEAGMRKIVEEVKRITEYYQKETGKMIKKIILSGGTALLPGIDKFFRAHFQDIKIEIGDPLQKIKRRGGIDPNKALLYANSLGLALRSIFKDPIGGGINLLPRKIKEKEKKVYWKRHRQKLITIRIIVVVLIAVVAFLAYSILGGSFKLPYN